MNVRSFGNIERVPKLSEKDRSNIAELVHNKMKKMLALMPKPDTDSHDKTAESLPKVTKIVMQIVHVIRNADKATHSKVWDKCSKDKRMM